MGFIFPDIPMMSTLGPVIGLIFAMIIATIVGLIATKIVGMKIPIMVRCTAEIAGAGAFSCFRFICCCNWILRCY